MSEESPIRNLGMQTIKISKPFTETELARFSQVLSNKHEAISELKDEKKAVAKEYDSKIAALENSISTISRNINFGKETQEVATEAFVNYDTKTRFYKDLITGEVIHEEPMHKEDAQVLMNLGSELPASGKIISEDESLENGSGNETFEKAIESVQQNAPEDQSTEDELKGPLMGVPEMQGGSAEQGLPQIEDAPEDVIEEPKKVKKGGKK